MAQLLTTVIKSTEQIFGGWVERGFFTLTPAVTSVISSDLAVECTADSNISANVGDQIFVNARNLTSGLIPSGARVTAKGIVAVKLTNITGSTVTDSTATTYDYELVHYS